MCKKGLRPSPVNPLTEGQTVRAALRPPQKSPCHVPGGTLHEAAFERQLPALTLFMAPPFLHKICLSIRKNPLGSSSNPGSWKDLPPLGGRKPGPFGCFPAGARQGYPGSWAGCLPGRAGQAREGVSKENLSLWLKMCGAGLRDEVGLAVRIWRRENIDWCLNSICKGGRGDVDSHWLWSWGLGGVRHREATHHAFIGIANAPAWAWGLWGQQGFNWHGAECTFWRFSNEALIGLSCLSAPLRAQSSDKHCRGCIFK